METTPEMKVHAELSPSGADRWMTCQGSVIETAGLPDTDNAYSTEGTDYHELAAICLDNGTDAEDYVGHQLPSGALVTADNAKDLQRGYVEPVRAYAAQGKLLVEQSMSLAWYSGVATDKGTSDAVILGLDRELIVADLKFGRGVEVSPEDNRQCKIYALGVILEQQLDEEYDQVRLVICQPRTGEGKPKEWVISMSDLMLFKDEVIRSAQMIAKGKAHYGMTKINVLPFVPSEKACRFCKAKVKNGIPCHALQNFVDNASLDGFESLAPKGPDVLGAAMDKVDLVEIWMKGVRAAVESELLADRPVSGYKLVQGKKGNRKWTDEEEVTKLFKSFRLKTKEMYDLSLISPTTADKLLSKDFPQRWEKVVPLYAQAPGGPSVAKASDKRPTYVKEAPSIEGFEVIAETVDCSDLI